MLGNTLSIFVQQARAVEAGMHQKDDAQRTFRDRILPDHGHRESRNHALDVHHGAEEVDDVGVVGSANGVGHDATRYRPRLLAAAPAK